MVRRRTASPKSSGPVRSTTRAPPPPSSSVPAARSAPAAAGAPPSQSGGFLSQMAATAGGVAIGSTVGHALGNMFGGGGSETQHTTPSADNVQQYKEQENLSHPCEFEWQQFLNCAQRQTDVGVCQSFNDIFKQCQTRYSPGSR